MNEPQEHVVTREEDGKTIAAVVRVMMGGAPWSRVRDLCQSGRVEIDGVRTTSDATRVKNGARISLNPLAKKRTRGVLDDEAIVFVDRDVVVVRKPPGMLTVPFEDGDRDTLVDVTRAALRRRDRGKQRARDGRAGSAGYDPELGVVSRLDKDTTGLVVFTRTVAAKRHLQQQFRVHSIERRYLALVHGTPRDGRVETILLADRGDGLRGSYGVFRAPKGPPPADAQRAVTHVRVIERFARASLVECKLETGRQHQIRIHLAEQGCPLVGEAVYVREQRGPKIAATRPMLHAAALTFVHPRTDEEVALEDAPPEDFLAMIATLRAEKPAAASAPPVGAPRKPRQPATQTVPLQRKPGSQ